MRLAQAVQCPRDDHEITGCGQMVELAVWADAHDYGTFVDCPNCGLVFEVETQPERNQHDRTHP